MSTILCFGDSNTFGYIPGGAGRYGEETRWPCVLEKLLDSGYRIVENGVLGRTTVFEDAGRPGKKGLADLVPALEKEPVDILVLMLGTNDCKLQFAASPRQIADGMVSLVSEARRVRSKVRIVLVSPPVLGSTALLCGDYNPESLEASGQLAAAYRRAAEENGCAFWDGAASAVVSPEDGEHLTAEGHQVLAQDLYEVVCKL